MAKNKSLQAAQKAFEKGNKARAKAKKKGVTSSYKPEEKKKKVTQPKQQEPKTPAVTSKKGAYDYQSDIQQAYQKGKNTTYLGTQQKSNTTKISGSLNAKDNVNLRGNGEERKQAAQQAKSYYKSKNWKNTKNELKTKNQEGWRKALSDQGWSRKEIDDFMNSEEGMKLRRETYRQSKKATKDAINESILKGVKDSNSLESVNALTKQEFQQMVTASGLGKRQGNKYLKSVGGKELQKKIGSKTAKSAIDAKIATGVMQGMSKADIFSGSVGKYDAGAKSAIEKTKESKGYLGGYGVGFAADMLMGGVASRGASVAEGIGKAAGAKGAQKVTAKVAGKEAGELSAKAAREASEEYAKLTGKEMAGKFARNRAGDLVAETPSNVLDAAKMSMDSDGNLNKDEFKKWLVFNSALTGGMGGAMEGLGAAVAKKQAKNTMELLAKQRAGTITREESAKLGKYIDKLTKKADNSAVSGAIAQNTKRDIKLSSQEARIEKKLQQKQMMAERLKAIESEKATATNPEAIAKLNAEESVIKDAQAKTEVPKGAMGKGNVTPTIKAINEAPEVPKVSKNKPDAKAKAEKEVHNSLAKYSNSKVKYTADEVRQISKGIDNVAEQIVRGNKEAAREEAEKIARKHGKIDEYDIAERPEKWTQVKDAQNYLKGITIHVPQLGSLKHIQEHYTGKFNSRVLHIRKSTTGKNHSVGIDEIWDELCAEYPEVFSKETVDEGDRLRELAAVSSMKKSDTFDYIPRMDDELNAMYEEVVDSIMQAAEKGAKANSNADAIKVAKGAEKEAKSALETAEAELKSLDDDGAKYWVMADTAKKAGDDGLYEEYHAIWEDIQKQKRLKEREIKNLKGDVTEAQNEISKNGGYAYDPNDKMPVANTSAKGNKEAKQKIDDVAKKAEEEYSAMPDTPKPKNADADGVINSEFGNKEGIRKHWQTIRQLLVDDKAPLEDIARRLPEPARSKMLAQINEMRRATKTGRALVAEKGRKIYSDYGLTKRGTDQKRHDFEEYCFLQHALDRKKVDKDFMPNTSATEIKEKISALENNYAHLTNKNGELDIAKFQERMTDYFSNELLEREVASGITSREEANNFKKMYPHYVPTYAVKDFDDILKKRTLDEIDVGRGIKEAKGGDYELVPLYNQMQVKTNAVLKRTELNNTLNVLCMASGTTKEELESLLPVFKKMPDEEKPQALLDSQVFVHEAERKNYATMYHNGEPIKISIDKDVADVIRSWSGEERKWMTVAKLLDNVAFRTLGGQFKKWITDYNLFFGLKNFKRDTATALFYTNDLKGYLRNYPKAMIACWTPEKLLPESYKLYKDAFKAYKENGGVVSQFVARDSASPNFFDAINPANPLKWVENFNSSLETVPRMAEFLSAMETNVTKKAGKSISQMSDKEFETLYRNALKDHDIIADSMYRAKDLTLNFDRGGSVGKILNRGFVPFFNPAVQGLDKLGRKVVTDSIKRGAGGQVLVKDTAKAYASMGAALMGMVALPSAVWNRLPDAHGNTIQDYINGDVEGWEKQSDYNRYANYLLPLPDGKFLKIPRARELASMQAPLDFVLDNMLYGSGSTWEKMFGNKAERDFIPMAKIAAEQIGPVSPFKDNLISPLWRAKHNETWYGGKIESGTKDAQAREEGRYKDIWDEDTSWLAKQIGDKFNVSPKKADNIMDSYLGIIYDMTIQQQSAKNSTKGEGAFTALTSILSSTAANNFIIDSVFRNANATDFYDYSDKLDKELSKYEEGSKEYTKVHAEIAKDKNAFGYTSSQYEELLAQIYLDKSLTRAERNKYARMLKADQNTMWRDWKDGNGVSSRDPMNDAWNLKDSNGKRILSTEKIIDACSFTTKNGTNTIKDAWNAYKELGGKAGKFMEVTLAARDVNRAAGDSLSSPRWEVVAYSTELNNIKGADKVVSAYIEKASTLKTLTENAALYAQYGGNLKNYKTMRNTITQGAYDLGYDYVSEMRDGELAMTLANARTKKGNKYRDLAYQANNWYIQNRMNAARCLDEKKNGNYKASDIKATCDKHKLEANSDYTWDVEKVKKAIEADYPDASNEVKAAVFQVITGYTKQNPYGSIGDYSLDSDTGVHCSGHGGYGHGRRRRRGRRGGGGGGGKSSFTPIINTAGKHAKVTNTSKKNYGTKSNLDDAYRKKLKKLREATRK